MRRSIVIQGISPENIYKIIANNKTELLARLLHHIDFHFHPDESFDENMMSKIIIKLAKESDEKSVNDFLSTCEFIFQEKDAAGTIAS